VVSKPQVIIAAKTDNISTVNGHGNLLCAVADAPLTVTVLLFFSASDALRFFKLAESD